MTDKIEITRRGLVCGASVAACLTFAKAHGMEKDKIVAAIDDAYATDRDDLDIIPYPNVHEGLGTIDIKFFRFEGATDPSLMLIYDIPPGASEGVHTHKLGDEEAGSFDEFYYIMEGNGVMDIDGETVEVTRGDHVFTPNGIPHGIRNTQQDKQLKVFLTAIRR